MPFLLAERAQWKCARSMRAVKGSLGHSLDERVMRIGRPSPGIMARPDVPVGGRVRSLGCLSNLPEDLRHCVRREW